jgi:hypothetical protein
MLHIWFAIIAEGGDGAAGIDAAIRQLEWDDPLRGTASPGFVARPYKRKAPRERGLSVLRGPMTRSRANATIIQAACESGG